MNTRLLASLAAAFLLPASIPAQVPQLLNYQGRIAVGTVNFDGAGQFKFALVNAGGTTTYWSNDGTSTAGSEPTAAVALAVAKGLYAVQLGDTALANMTAIPPTVFTNADVRLRVWFNDGTNGFQLLTPDQRIAAVGYAMMADGVKDGAITAAKIADGAVGSAKIAAGAVTAGAIANGAVGGTQMAPGAAAVNLDAGATNGIGTTTPAAKLHLGGGPEFSQLAELRDGVASDYLNGSWGIAISGNVAIVSSFTDDAFLTLDITSPSQPSVLAARSVLGGHNLNGAEHVAISGTTALITARFDNAVNIVDISNPSNPTVVSYILDSANGFGLPFEFLAAPTGVAVSGTLAAVTSFTDSAVTFFDISTPSLPAFRSTIRHGVNGYAALAGASRVTFSGTLAYITSSTSGGLTIVDVANPVSPVLVAQVKDGDAGFPSLGGAWGVAVSGTIAVVAATSDHAFTVIDVSNPSAPVPLAAITDGASGFTRLNGAMNPLISGTRLFIPASGDAAVTVADMSNPASPTLIAEWVDGGGGHTMLSGARGIALTPDGKAIVTAFSDAGVGIYNSNSGRVDLATQNRVGIGTSTPTTELEVIGTAKATAFAGNGAALTNLHGANITTASITTTQLGTGSVQSADVLDGTIGTADLADGAVTNGKLANSSLTVTAGAGLAGGGVVSLGGNVTLSNAGVTSLTGGGGITISGSTGSVTLGSNATAVNTPDTLVLRDPSGNFSAGTITGTFVGNGAGLTNLSGASIAAGSIGSAQLATGAVETSLNVGDGTIGIGLSAGMPAATLHLGGGPLAGNQLAEVRDDTGRHLNGAWGVAVSGNLAIVTGFVDDGYTILDITSPSQPLILSQTSSAVFDGAEHVAISGSVALITTRSSDSVRIVSISNPSNPTTLTSITHSFGGTYQYLDAPTGIAVSGTLAAVCSFNSNAVTFFEFATPNAPVFRSVIRNGVGGYTALNGASRVTFSGNLAYITSYGSGSLTIVDVSTPTAPVLVAEIKDGDPGYTSLAGAWGVAISGTTAVVVANLDNAFTVIDVTNPSVPTPLATITDGSSGFSRLAGPMNPVIKGSRLYIPASGDNAVTVVDISNPSAPVLIAEWVDGVNGRTMLEGARGIAFLSGGEALVTAFNDAGVGVFDVEAQVDLVTQNRVGIGTSAPSTELEVVGTVKATNLQGALNGSFLADGSVSAIKLAPDSVLTSHILNGTLLAEDMADGAVTSAKLAAGAVTSTKLAAGAVTNAAVSDGAITSAKLAAGAVTSAAIGSGAVTSTHLATGAVTAASIADGAVTTAKVANGAITAAQIAPGTITNTQIAQPPQAGSLSGFDLTLATPVPISVTFPTPYDSPPVVMANFWSSTPEHFSSAPFTLTSYTATGFTGTVDRPASAPVAVTTTDGYSHVSSLCVSAFGAPAFAMRYDSSPTLIQLRYWDALDVTGSAWGTVSNVVFQSNETYTPTHISLAMNNGYPMIATYVSSTGNLVFHRAVTQTGSNWAPAVVVASTGDVGNDCVLLMVNGRPAICYRDATNSELKFIRASDSDGGSWPAEGTAVTVDSTGGAGASMAIVNGNPAIAYRDPNTSDLKYVRATNADGTAWGTPVVLESADDTGFAPSLTVVNGRPAIAFRNHTQDDVRFIRALNTNGTSWPATATVVETGMGNGLYTQLGVFDGRPMISYADGDNGALRFAVSSDGDGTAWTPRALDSGSNVGGMAMTSLNSAPAIIYKANTGDDLKFIWLRMNYKINWIALPQ